VAAVLVAALDALDLERLVDETRAFGGPRRRRRRVVGWISIAVVAVVAIAGQAAETARDSRGRRCSRGREEATSVHVRDFWR
jgi:hypothetical protein